LSPYRARDEDGNLRNDDDEMIENINNRRIFRFGYFGYGIIMLTSHCCCCKKFMLRKWKWYRSVWFSYQKFKKARSDLTREKDIEHMIYNMRIMKFIQKTLLKKRQRDIVQYFMRYVVEDDEIKSRDISRR